MIPTGSRVPSGLQFSPMLARDLPGDFGAWPALASPKIDGVRGLAVRDEHGARLYTRTGLWRLKPTRTLDALVLTIEPGRPGTQFARMMGRLVCQDLQTGARFRVGSGFDLADHALKPREPIFHRRRPDRRTSQEAPGSHPTPP